MVGRAASFAILILIGLHMVVICCKEKILHFRISTSVAQPRLYVAPVQHLYVRA
jgi:hypothetical protein